MQIEIQTTGCNMLDIAAVICCMCKFMLAAVQVTQQYMQSLELNVIYSFICKYVLKTTVTQEGQ